MGIHHTIRRGVVVISVIAAAACRAEATRSPAEDAYRALKRIAGATAIGVNKQNYDALLQDAAGEVFILKDLAVTTADSTVLRYYVSAVEKYKDAGALWSEQIDDARYDWMPKRRIMLPESALAARYNLPTTNHKMPYTGTEYQTVPQESIQKIWTIAESTADSANSLLLPQLRRRVR